MSKTREIQCKNYICHGQCKLGKDADFYGLCQTCPSYRKASGKAPARTDQRQQKLNNKEK